MAVQNLAWDFGGVYIWSTDCWVLSFTPIWSPLSLEIWSTPLAVDTWSEERGYVLTLMVSNLWHRGKANFSPWSNLQMTNFPTFQRRYDGKHPFPHHLNHCAFHLHGYIFGCLQHAWVWRSHYLGPLFPEKLTCTGMKENNIMKKIYNQQVEPYVVRTLSVTWDYQRQSIKCLTFQTDPFPFYDELDCAYILESWNRYIPLSPYGHITIIGHLKIWTEAESLRLVFTSDGVRVKSCNQRHRAYDLVKTAFWFYLRLHRLRSAYDLVKTGLLESEAEAEELNQSQSIGTCIVIGLSLCFCFRLLQSGFHQIISRTQAMES